MQTLSYQGMINMQYTTLHDIKRVVTIFENSINVNKV